MSTKSRQSVGVIVKVGVVLAVIGGMVWLVLHRRDVMDWWTLQTYKPGSDIVALADAAGMQGHGRDLFYVSDPKVQQSTEFNQSCREVGEEGAVLGCYAAQKIYIYDVSDPRLPNVKVVTAAHEMLHAAYERLDVNTKQHIDALVRAEADKLKDDSDLQSAIKYYDRNEPGQMASELHSIIGTEYGNLSPDLEAYYKTYFSDRTKVVALAQAYRQVFADSKKRIAEYDTQLTSLKEQITTLENDLKAKRAELDSEDARLQELRNSDVAAYNSAVPGYNAKVRAFNTQVKKYTTLVAQFNDMVAKRNEEAAARNDLFNSIDSKYHQL